VVGEGVETAVAHTVAVLVVACPCALALSQPLAAAAGLGAAARRGLLFRNADALLQVADVDVIALDKTGTVTAGQLTVVDADDATLRIAADSSATARTRSRGPSSTRRRRGAFRCRAARRCTRRRASASRGAWTAALDAARGWAHRVLLDGEYGERHVLRWATWCVGDAAATVAALRRDGVELALLTGDHADVAQRIAGLTGLDIVVSRIDPQGRPHGCSGMRDSGKRVLFAGTGSTTGRRWRAPSGHRDGHGAASSVLVADGVIAEPALRPLLGARRAARACHKAIRFNHAGRSATTCWHLGGGARVRQPLVCAC
jgi:Cu+-exporting ATPase